MMGLPFVPSSHDGDLNSHVDDWGSTAGLPVHAVDGIDVRSQVLVLGDHARFIGIGVQVPGIGEPLERGSVHDPGPRARWAWLSGMILSHGQTRVL
jgi:hypothetical protein